jgi:predicted RNase H-like HicB family nuclease
MTEFRVDAEWDSEANVWVATSPNVAGLIVQGRTKDEVIEKVRLVLPGLYEIGIEPDDTLHIFFRREQKDEESRLLLAA